MLAQNDLFDVQPVLPMDAVFVPIDESGFSAGNDPEMLVQQSEAPASETITADGALADPEGASHS